MKPLVYFLLIGIGVGLLLGLEIGYLPANSFEYLPYIFIGVGIGCLAKELE